ncbi:hypothetical protein Tco_0839288 [Tanacetum coccineum]|uniref:Uncharacterized protein n=1 Tax=Tanacetum coccineum TaxID=301880 RepID=A0ABQ5AR92_9ASTR
MIMKKSRLHFYHLSLQFINWTDLSPQHIDEFDLNDEISLSEYDEEEQNVLYFNDLFPFNIIHPDDLKSEKGNDDSEIDKIQSSGANDSALDCQLGIGVCQSCQELLEAKERVWVNGIYLVALWVKMEGKEGKRW